MNWKIEYEPDLGKYSISDNISWIGRYTDEELQELYVLLINSGIVTKCQQSIDRREMRKREEEVIVYSIEAQKVL